MRDLITAMSIDAASLLIKGKRAAQEDALASDFQVGSKFGYAVLSDGMGGHEAGDVASQIIVTEVQAEIRRHARNGALSPKRIAGILSGAAMAANERLRQYSAANPETAGMGATLIALIVMKDRMFWVSIGDSPLFLFRAGKLGQLNEDHSMAPQIDYLVRTGVISEREGRQHPDRNCLTSALLGEDIPRMDCSSEPFVLRPGDLVIAASDGLQFLSDSHIQRVLEKHDGAPSSKIAASLIAEINRLDDPYQDNVSLTVLKVEDQSRWQNFQISAHEGASLDRSI